MVTFLKAQTASLIATIVDFVVTVLVVQVFGGWYVTGNILGNIAGGVVNFRMGRDWAFNAEDGKMSKQAIKYILVWAGSILLNTIGIYLFTNYAGIDYKYSKVIAAVIVAFSYNYLLQKRYVFR